MRQILAVCLLLSAMPVAAHAQEPCPDETTAGLRRCLNLRLDSLTTELNRVYARARAESNDTLTLDSAQTMWRGWVMLDCRAAARIYQGGSLSPIVALTCRIDHTRMRIRHLTDDYLSDDSVGPGKRRPS